MRKAYLNSAFLLSALAFAANTGASGGAKAGTLHDQADASQKEKLLGDANKPQPVINQDARPRDHADRLATGAGALPDAQQATGHAGQVTIDPAEAARAEQDAKTAAEKKASERKHGKFVKNARVRALKPGYANDVYLTVGDTLDNYTGHLGSWLEEHSRKNDPDIDDDDEAPRRKRA